MPKTEQIESQIENPTKAVSCQFTMLPSESELIEEIRVRYQKEALSVRDKPADIVRSEIVRAGIWVLSKMDSKDLYEHLEALEILKEGRPKKQKVT